MRFLKGAAIAAAVTLAACAQTRPETTAGLSAEMPLAPSGSAGSPASQGLGGDTLVFRSPTLDVSKYRGFYIPAADVYQGPDADFGEIAPPDRQRLAQELTRDVAKALGRNRNVVPRPGPGIVTLQLSLAGVSNTRPILSLTRVTPVGLGITAIKSAEGMPAAFVGAVTVAGKFTDSATGQILGGFVTRQSPPAYDLRSSIGTMETAELALTHTASGLAKVIDTMAPPRR
ncbi:DUF3313 domain-containing protein [Inquilinus sp.]|uniref:DUF3313 domain-containing protein n=1 Tax=Inquilinus sp. TaxID=1932117 RepID=UPI0031D4AC35